MNKKKYKLLSVLTLSIICTAVAFSACKYKSDYITNQNDKSSENNNCVSSSETISMDNKKTAATGTKPTSTVKSTKSINGVITHNLVMYKGESRILDFINLSSDNKPVVKSSDKQVISVKKNKIIAKKCGTSNLTVRINDRKNSYTVILKIKVRISSVKKSADYKKSKSSKKGKIPVLVVHKKLNSGETYKLKVSGVNNVKYKSDNPRVATVNKKGTIYAKKSGTALIRCKILSGKKSYEFLTKIYVNKKESKYIISQKKINKFFSQSGFIGSSIGEGQKMYFSSQGAGFLGNPKMIVKGCYSFANDNGSNGGQYQLSWNNYTGPARYVVKRAHVKYLFINMGTNDLWDSPDNVYNKYVTYIKGIKSINPGIVIYIESTTPVCSNNQKGGLNNANVNKLNARIKKYCSSQKDVYYIDVNTPLKDSNGGLNGYYTSDGYVHISNQGYRIWTNTLIKYIKSQWINEQNAKDAVLTYKENKSKANLKIAKMYINKLEKSDYKTSLLKEIKK